MCISYHGNLCNYWHCPGQLRLFHNAHFLSRDWESHLRERQISTLQALSMRFQMFFYWLPWRSGHNGVSFTVSLWEDPGPWACPPASLGRSQSCHHTLPHLLSMPSAVRLRWHTVDAFWTRGPWLKREVYSHSSSVPSPCTLANTLCFFSRSHLCNCGLDLPCYCDTSDVYRSLIAYWSWYVTVSLATCLEGAWGTLKWAFPNPTFCITSIASWEAQRQNFMLHWPWWVFTIM